MEDLFTAIPKIVDSLQNNFTTHELIIALAKQYQHDYIKALHDQLKSKRPFQTLHSNIGQYLILQRHLGFQNAAMYS